MRVQVGKLRSLKANLKAEVGLSAMILALQNGLVRPCTLPSWLWAAQPFGKFAKIQGLAGWDGVQPSGSEFIITVIHKRVVFFGLVSLYINVALKLFFALLSCVGEKKTIWIDTTCVSEESASSRFGELCNPSKVHAAAAPGWNPPGARGMGRNIPRRWSTIQWAILYICNFYTLPDAAIPS